MKVTLLTSPEFIKDMENNAAIATLTCHANTEKPYVPHEVLGRIIKAGHESILEHITLTYSVKGLSRACLQELARHRHISLSVESTRHTLRKRLKEIDPDNFFPNVEVFDIPYKTPEGRKCHYIADYLRFIKNEEWEAYPEDELKYLLPEFWPTNLILTCNIRELRHILKLRTAPAALKEFQVLARELFNTVPDEFKYLLKDCVYRDETRQE